MDTQHKIGDIHDVAGIRGAILVNLVNVDDVDYELWSGGGLKEKRGAIRVFDTESSQTVTVRLFPTFRQALLTYWETIHRAVWLPQTTNEVTPC